MYNITFLPYNITIKAQAGTRIIESAIQAGIHINASCGSAGLCGKCQVIIREGTVEGGKSTRLKEDEIAKGVRLACTAQITGDLVVAVPVETGLVAHEVAEDSFAGQQQIDLSSYNDDTSLCNKVYPELQEPDASDNRADATRLTDALAAAGYADASVSLAVLRKLPGILREAGYAVTVTVLDYAGEKKVIHVQPGKKEQFIVAIDIGTTTVHAELIQASTGKKLAHCAKINAQVAFGEDIITRIVFSEKSSGMEKIQQAVFTTVNEVVAAVIEEARLTWDDISLLFFAANTTMGQLFAGIDSRFLRRIPYVPAMNTTGWYSAKECGLNEQEHVYCSFSPHVASFVGGDIVAGVFASGMATKDTVCLYIDIGTNAEIVIGNKEWLVCTAASAGPAFEGGGVESGMRHARGAITDFSLHAETSEVMIVTAENSPAVGICGSGLIAIVSALFENNIINSAGKFDRKSNCDKIRDNEGVYEFVVVPEQYAAVDRDITISEIDIENFMRAKGAIFAACATLLAELGLSFAVIENIYLAGAFGSHLNLEQAMTVGLLPEIDKSRISYLGNTALMGARLAALSQRACEEQQRIAGKMTNFELAEVSSYMDHYTASLFFPHTDMSYFPSHGSRMAATGE